MSSNWQKEFHKTERVRQKWEGVFQPKKRAEFYMVERNNRSKGLAVWAETHPPKSRFACAWSASPYPFFMWYPMRTVVGWDRECHSFMPAGESDSDGVLPQHRQLHLFIHLQTRKVAFRSHRLPSWSTKTSQIPSWLGPQRAGMAFWHLHGNFVFREKTWNLGSLWGIIRESTWCLFTDAPFFFPDAPFFFPAQVWNQLGRSQGWQVDAGLGEVIGMLWGEETNTGPCLWLMGMTASEAVLRVSLAFLVGQCWLYDNGTPWLMEMAR